MKFKLKILRKNDYLALCKIIVSTSQITLLLKIVVKTQLNEVIRDEFIQI